jgi:hypothetical protein
LSDKVADEGGLPVKIALFPKSKNAILNADYSLMMDKFLLMEEIDCKTENWNFDIQYHGCN